MATITFKKKFAPLRVEDGVVLMDALLAHGRPVGSSCGGEGVCSKCMIRIVAGQENLSPINAIEAKWRESRLTPEDQRMSCQALVLGSIEVDADYW